MAPRFYLSTEDINGFKADQWLQTKNEQLADDWLEQQLNQPAPTIDESLARLGSGFDAPQASPEAPQPTPTLGAPAVPTEPSQPSEPSVAPQGFNPDLLDLSKPAPVAPDVPLPSPSTSPRAPSPTRPAAAQPSGGFVDYARQAAQRAGIDPDLFVRQINQESGFDPTAGSSAGARGIAQIVPKWHPGVDVTDPYASLDYAAKLMKSHLQTYGGDISKALVAYNGGQGAVNAFTAGKPYTESRDYLDKILSGGGSTPTTQDPNKVTAFQTGNWEAIARSQLGDPYVWGSKGGRQDMSDNPAGFDCSGFVSWVYNKGLGLNLPAFTGSIQQVTQSISPDDARPGDLVMLMNSPDPTKQHVGIYIGNGQMINSTGGGVQIGAVWDGMEYRRDPRVQPGQSVDLLSSAIDTAIQRPATDQEQDRGEQARQALAPRSDETVSNPFGEAFRQLGAVKDQVGGALSAVPEAIGNAMLTQGDVNRGTVDTVGRAATDLTRSTAESLGENLLTQGEIDRRTVEQAGQFTDAASADLARQQRESDPFLSMTPLGVPDLGSAVNQGLNRAGIPEFRVQAGPLDVGSNALIGFGAGMAVPMGPEGKAAGVAGKVLREGEQAVGKVANDTLLNMYGGVKTAARSPVPSGGEEFRRTLVRQLTDRGVDLAEYQKQAQRAAGRPLTLDEQAATLRRLNPSGAAEMRIQNELRPAVQSVGEDTDWLKVYLTHQDNIDVSRAMGNAERDFSGGLSVADSKAGLADMARQLGPERMAKIENSAQQVWDYGKSLLQRKVESGLISQDLFDDLAAKYPHYSPTRIVDFMKEPANIPSGRKISVQSAGLKRNTVEGTTRQREDPLASFYRLAHETEALSAKNDVAQAFLKLRDLTPDGKLMIREVADDVSTPRGFEKMKVFTDGTPQSYMMPDYIARAIKEEPVAPIPIVTPLMNLFRAVATQRNPLFLASNALVDFITATIRTSSRMGGPQHAPRVAAEIIKVYGDTFQGIFSGTYKGAATQRYIGEGGAMSGPFFSRTAAGPIADVPFLERVKAWAMGRTVQSSKDLTRELARPHVFHIQSGRELEDIKRLVGQGITLKPVEAVGERIELAPRVAAMRLAELEGANQAESVLAGRTVTIDFSTGGTFVKTLNQVIPFFNVAVQGGAQLPRAFRENPRGFVSSAIGMLAAPTVAAEAWNRSDAARARDYDDVPQYVKDQGLVVMLPTPAQVDERGNRKPQYLFFPTREYSPFVTLTREAAGRAMGQEPRAWNELLMGTAQSVSPIRGETGADVVSTFVPLGVSTGMQLATNRDWFRNRQIATQQADEEASALGKVVAGAFRSMGIEESTPGVGGISRPSQVDFLVRDVGAGVGSTMLAGSDVLAGRPRRDERIQSTPGVGGLVGRFVQDRTGERLSKAIDQPIPASMERAMKDAGVSPPTIPPDIRITSDVTGSTSPPIALHQDERAEYQRLMAQRLQELRGTALASPDWQTRSIDYRKKSLEEAIRLARKYAENTLYGQMDKDDRQKRMQAGRESSRPKPKP